AVVTDLNQGEAGVLLVIGAEATVIWASPFHGGVVNQRHLGGLDEEFAAAAVIVYVVGDEDVLGPMVGTALEKVNLAVLEDDFGFYLSVTGGADRERNVVEEIGTGLMRHGERSEAEAVENRRRRLDENEIDESYQGGDQQRCGRGMTPDLLNRLVGENQDHDVKHPGQKHQENATGITYVQI